MTTEPLQAPSCWHICLATGMWRLAWYIHLQMTGGRGRKRNPRLVSSSGSEILTGKHWKLGDRNIKSWLSFPLHPHPLPRLCKQGWQLQLLSLCSHSSVSSGVTAHQTQQGILVVTAGVILRAEVTVELEGRCLWHWPGWSRAPTIIITRSHFLWVGPSSLGVPTPEVPYFSSFLVLHFRLLLCISFFF